MNNNDSETTARYSVWLSEQLRDKEPEHNTWTEAHDRLTEGFLGKSGFRIWDHSTTPPTDVTDADPEGAHPPTPAPLIPDGVKELTIRRSEYKRIQLSMTVYGDGWQMYTETTPEEVLTRLHEIADAMEKIK